MPIEKYIHYKIEYGADIGVDVIIHRVRALDLKKKIEELNIDAGVDSIIIQLPIEDPGLTDEALNLIAPNKDVDGLGNKSNYDPATAVAILWLLSGYNIQFEGKKIYLVGNGRLVGRPLSAMLSKSNINHKVLTTKDDTNQLVDGDIIISATGQAGLITPSLIKPGAVFVDAGTVGEDGVIKGDASDELHQRDDISITPKLGGVGPLTISALFDNVLRAADLKRKGL